jgi:hypothetical protein
MSSLKQQDIVIPVLLTVVGMMIDSEVKVEVTTIITEEMLESMLKI